MLASPVRSAGALVSQPPLVSQYTEAHLSGPSSAQRLEVRLLQLLSGKDADACPPFQSLSEWQLKVGRQKSRAGQRAPAPGWV